MRYDKQKHLVLVMMTVAYLHSQGRNITNLTIWRTLPEGFLDLAELTRAVKYLTDIGAIVWIERARRGRPGRIASINPEIVGLKLTPSRSAFEREVKAAVSGGVLRWKDGELVLDGETIVTEDFVAACRQMFPKKPVSGEWLFSVLDGLPLRFLLDSKNSLETP